MPLSDAPIRSPLFPSEAREFIVAHTQAWARWLADLVRAVNAGAHVSGTTTFAASGTATVTFTAPETGTSYKLQLSGNANETFYWSGKTTTGFTLRSSNPLSVATVDWILTR